MHDTVRALSARQGAADPAWLGERRAAALARFLEVGLPAPKQELWKYSPTKRLGEAPWFSLPEAPAVPEADLAALGYGELDAHRLVLVDGAFSPALSDVGELPKGARLRPLSQVLAEDPESIRPHLGQIAHVDHLSFGALSAALSGDGFVLQVPADTKLVKPVLLACLATRSGAASFPRLLLVLGAGAKATVLEAYVGPDGVAYTRDAVVEVALGANASLVHLRDQREGDAGYHVCTSRTTVAAGARYVCRAFNQGAGYSRTDLEVALLGEEADCELDVLSALRGAQHGEIFTSIDHALPRGRSNELVKTVLDDRSTGVFRGRVHVAQDAQLTDSQQQNKNLLLSADAQINTKPELEIYADDVKAAHGATIGQLDAEALFFLRARGISKADARRLLVQAFAQDLLNRVEVEAARDAMKAVFSARFTGGEPVV